MGQAWPELGSAAQVGLVTALQLVLAREREALVQAVREV
jgi:hypothetical protein